VKRIDENILFTLWSAKDTIESFLEEHSKLYLGCWYNMLEEEKEALHSMLNIYDDYLKGAPIPEEELWEDD